VIKNILFSIIRILARRKGGRKNGASLGRKRKNQVSAEKCAVLEIERQTKSRKRHRNRVLEHGLKKPAVEPKRVALEVHFMQRNFKLRTDPQAEILKNKKKKENSVEKMSWNEEWRNE